MTEPASWLQIAPGWSVVGSDGGALGEVLSVAGDKPRDIFDGLAIGVGDSSAPRYVPAEDVVSIHPGEVTLRLASTEVGTLEVFEDPAPVTVWRPPKPSLKTRFSNWLQRKR